MLAPKIYKIFKTKNNPPKAANSIAERKINNFNLLFFVFPSDKKSGFPMPEPNRSTYFSASA